MGPSTRARIYAFAAGAVISVLAMSAFASSAASPRPLKYPTKNHPRAPRLGPSELPDPAPLYAKGRHRIAVNWDKQTPSIVTVNTVDIARPESVERWAGRFAFELFEGTVLIERVRFNFPMLGGASSVGGRSMASVIDENLSSTAEVVFPATSRGDRLELRDRATGNRWQLAWPPRVVPVRPLNESVKHVNKLVQQP